MSSPIVPPEDIDGDVQKKMDNQKLANIDVTKNIYYK